MAGQAVLVMAVVLGWVGPEALGWVVEEEAMVKVAVVKVGAREVEGS